MSKGIVLVRLVHVLSRVPEANPYALALGAGVLIVTTGIAQISSRVHGALISLVGAGLVVALFHLGGRGVNEPPRVSRRLFGLSHAAMGVCSSIA